MDPESVSPQSHVLRAHTASVANTAGANGPMGGGDDEAFRFFDFRCMIGGSLGSRVMFDRFCIDVRWSFDRCSIDGFSLDVRWIFIGCLSDKCSICLIHFALWNFDR